MELEMTPADLRIACLIPSATDICVALGLSQSIVGVTHECSRKGLLSARILTADGVAASTSSQREIHDRVQANSEQAVCAIDQQLEVPSLYPILADQLKAAAPTLILTQDLCNVCAPSSSSVQALAGDGPRIVSLTPHSLSHVFLNIQTVADACGIASKGSELVQDLQSHLAAIRAAVDGQPSPTMFVLEWLDPPFDGGHWIPDMMHWAGVQPAIIKADRKSTQLAWSTVHDTAAEVVLVACCGCNLQRNVADAQQARHELKSLSASRAGRLFAVNGDQYFARPGPKLIQGAAIMALCAFAHEPKVVEALEALDFVQEACRGFQRLDFNPTTKEPTIVDLEDFTAAHDAACERQEKFYTDPVTGYSVFTEYAHKLRGKCCGSGCRHCPYNHENVKDKTAKIQQPAFLHQGEEGGIFSLNHGRTRVMFCSGGKDSFLTIRALAREANEHPFGLVLLTTFDATSREIAHQEMSIEIVVRQAQHLGIALVGVPMHRGSMEPYADRVRRGLDLIERHVGEPVSTLVFGDLHLDHVQRWRKDHLRQLGSYEMAFPLWKVDYRALEQDLERSQIRVVLSASTIDTVKAGDVYDREFRERLAGTDVDVFGENGEFHTEAQVWIVDRATALGVN